MQHTTAMNVILQTVHATKRSKGFCFIVGFFLQKTEPPLEKVAIWCKSYSVLHMSEERRDRL